MSSATSRKRFPRESAKARRERAARIMDRLAAVYPAVCGLRHDNPYQLLIATILSAQCTDEAVNRVTPALFERFPSPEALAGADSEVVEALINSLGLFRNKAKSLRGASARLVSEYGGRVPDTMEQLLTLPGVARKTANVVLGSGFGIASGVVVDTHVQRLAQRLGLTSEHDPVKIERDLMALLAVDRWIDTSHLLIWHGRRCCTARKANCDTCPVEADCAKAGLPPGA